MKTLVVYFSRTGNTQVLAEQIAQACAADLESIQESRDRRGMWGYLTSLSEALWQKEASIAPSERDPQNYDLVVLGTPIWAWNMASPVRRYLVRHRGLVRNLALFCTYGGAGEAKVFSDMQALSNCHARAQLAVLARDVQNDRHQLQLARFVDELKNVAAASSTQRNPRADMATPARSE